MSFARNTKQSMSIPLYLESSSTGGNVNPGKPASVGERVNELAFY